jgi:hypothetical protein
LIISQSTNDSSAALDTYFETMAKPAESMELPSKAVTYLTDDPAHAIEVGGKYGVEILTPSEAELALPRFAGLGAHLS